MRDEDAFGEFVTARWAALVRTAFLITGDHGRAEDLVQSALEKVHTHWNRIQNKEAPEAYARRVMINLAISGSRRRRFRETSLEAAPDVQIQDGVQDLAERDELWKVLLQLPPRMRAVLVLRFFDDLSEAETARVLGCSLGSVKSQASRGLARMRELYAASGSVADSPLEAIEGTTR